MGFGHWSLGIHFPMKLPVFPALLALAALISACQSVPPSPFPPAQATLGSVERLDPALDELLAPGSRMEVLGSGFNWSEGPVWLASAQGLLFSDVPENTAYRWQPSTGVRVFLKPSGYTGSVPRGGETGSNGLAASPDGRLLLCQHGNRQIARLERDGSFTPLATHFAGKRFSSPNDLAVNSRGDLYFTDPPYGLEKNNADPQKETPCNGVYRRQPDGTVTLLLDSLTFPNGLAFSPDEKTLYVAVSDPKNAVIMAYEISPDGRLAKGRVFFDANPLTPGRKGLPDGLKVDVKGNLWATGPGGVLILSPQGKHLGTLLTGESTGNCAFGPDGYLYITADMHLVRIRTRTQGRVGN